jgi:PAS domain S-box-containing protein
VPPPESELEEFFDLSIDPLSIIGLDGEFKRANASFVRILGYPKAELFSRSALDILHPDDTERAREALAQLVEVPELVGFEARVICADGSVRWFEWNVRAVPEQGIVYSVARDTTERRAVEAELREAQCLIEARRDELLHVLAEEQAALRRVATLVAEDVPSRELFDAVAREVGRLFGADFSGMIRYEDDESVTTVATWAAAGEHPPVPARWDIEPGDPPTIIASTREATRVEDWTSVPGSMAAVIRDELGVRSSVGCPIVAEGRLWGALAIHSTQSRPLPPGTESRIAQFTDLVGTAIANAEARAEVERLAEEQAALRRLATLVAQEAPLEAVFAKVGEEVARTVGDVDSALWRDDGDGTATAVAVRGPSDAPRASVGTRLSLDGDSVIAEVLREGRPHQIDDYSRLAGSIAERARRLGLRSAVGCPIVVRSRTWGVMTVATYGAEPFARDTETRVARFSDLVATAITNAEARAEIARLAQEQAALRRVATLVARQASQTEVVTAIADEVGRLLGTEEFGIVRFEDDSTAVVVASSARGRDVFDVGSRHRLGGENAVTRVYKTRLPVRVDAYSGATGPIGEGARAIGLRSLVATPIMVEGRLWGAMLAGTTRNEPVPPDTELRLGQFTELMATAIANTESYARAKSLADDQAALRRVATLVARGVGPEAVFRAVADEAGALLGCDTAAIVRFEADGTATMMGAHNARREPGTRFDLDPNYVVASVRETGGAARFDADDPTAPGMPEPVRAEGIRSGLASPIVVDGELWGTITVASLKGPLPASTAQRLADFTELVATAISNTQAREELRRIADEQAALRRVATLVAEAAEPAEVFGAVSAEVGGLFGSEVAVVAKFDPDGPALIVVGLAKETKGLAIGSRFELDESTAAAEVYRTGRPARIDPPDWSPADTPIGAVARGIGVVSAVASPIVVEGRRWGVISLSAKETLPLRLEDRLQEFTEIVATAIANAESREALRRLAAEQAALRRVATLVAEGAEPAAVFDAVATEMEALLGADWVTLGRYEPGAEITIVANRGLDAPEVPVGTRWRHEDRSITSIVRTTERPARIEHYRAAQELLGERADELGVRAVVAAPIVVDGRLWGLAVANWIGDKSPPADTEDRMAQFAEMLDTAIANADSRDQLAASRARLVTAADDARRRVVRDLHDGAQQRLIHTIVTLKLARRALQDENGKAEALVGEALEHAERGTEELRELVHGILPAVLTRGGLQAGVRSLVSRLDLPVAIDVAPDRLSAEVEASAYFIVAEALTNVVKHAHAHHARVTASVGEGTLDVAISDDGNGGADPNGHGLLGMRDRVTALGGRLEIESPEGGGTVVAAALPLSAG